ncbi:hypothetical protein NXS19_007935 [Fusarium pseudograminearum]|nr:hypothetical protein NXS19_007935 [Fusarium pseudograminearum]
MNNTGERVKYCNNMIAHIPALPSTSLRLHILTLSKHPLANSEVSTIHLGFHGCNCLRQYIKSPMGEHFSTMSIYAPLNPGSVRLLRLPTSTVMVQELEVASFHLVQSPPYNALSYCWGDLDRSRSMRCNGQTLMLTPHLEEAIDSLRLLERKTEWIWIDQICINQDDKTERAIQVDMMKDIYSSSLGTIVWLGPSVPGIDRLLTMVDLMSSFHKEDINPTGTRKRSRYTKEEFLTLGLPEAQDPAWSAFGEFLSRPWFVRSWVIQETALSKVPARMICGSDTISWEKLVPAASWLLSMCFHVSPLSLIPATLPALRSLKLFLELEQLGLPWDFTTLLNKAMRFKASDPRDRVYSLLALTDEASDTGTLPPPLQADYHKPTDEVFRDATRHIITSTGSLTILSLIRYVPNWNQYSSWAVDFTATTGWDRISYFDWDQQDHKRRRLVETLNRASSGRPAVVVNHLPDHVLGLEGLEIDTVNTTFEVMSKSDLASYDTQIWATWTKSYDHLKSRYHTSEAIARAFMVALTGDWSLNNRERMSDQPLSHFWEHMWQVYRRLRRDSGFADVVDAEQENIKYLMAPKSSSNDHVNVFSLHLDAAHERRLFLTKDLSYIGLGPMTMEKNDIICVLFGGATPFVLRRFGDCFRFIGECYVYDLMNGEAVDGLASGKFCATAFHLV